MKCHFIWDEKTKQKILIPGCCGSLHQEDLSNCCCPERNKSAEQIKNESENKRIKELEAHLAYMHAEYDKLLRIINRLNN